MSDILTRLEQATAEDQRAVIGEVLDYAYVRGWISLDDYGRGVRFWSVEAYLNAALILVPEGLYGKIGFGPNRANARIWLVTRPAVNASIKVPQPALALCIAALKAHEVAG